MPSMNLDIMLGIVLVVLALLLLTGLLYLLPPTDRVQLLLALLASGMSLAQPLVRSRRGVRRRKING